MSRIGIGVFIGAVALACASTQKANTRTFFYSLKSEVVEESPGHWTGPYKNRGVCVINVGERDEEAGVFTDAGTFDGVWVSPTKTSSCGVKTTSTCTFQDDSSYTTEAVLSCAPAPDGKLVFSGNAVVVRGTGRFEGIQGKQIVLKSQAVAPPPAEMRYDLVNFQYTLPKK
jgi:hypothetical protein